MRKVRNEYRFLLANAQDQLAVLEEDVEAAESVWAGIDPGPKRVQAIATRVDEIHEENARKLGRSSMIPDQSSALAAWIEFSKLIREHEEELGRFWIKKLEFTVTGRSPSVKLSGILESAAKYNLLADMLLADPLFTEISKQGAIAPLEDGNSSFSETVIEIDVNELMSRMES